MPVESGIYWDSIGSQRSTSGGSSGECSAGSRHYVDPWDLENYAYLRRHSVAGISQHQVQNRHRKSSQRLNRETRSSSEYWYPSSREPGYDAPSLVDEIYCGSAKQTHNAVQKHQRAIYEDDVPDYVGSYPVYAPLSEVHSTEDFEQKRRKCRYKSPGIKESQRHLRTECHSAMLSTEEKCNSVKIPTPHLDLNTYGHLKIDYTHSWNSLNRKISKS